MLNKLIDNVAEVEGNKVAEVTKQRLLGTDGFQKASSVFMAIREARLKVHAGTLIAASNLLGRKFDSQK